MGGLLFNSSKGFRDKGFNGIEGWRLGAEVTGEPHPG